MAILRMNLWLSLLHVSGFALPALGVASLLALAVVPPRLWMGSRFWRVWALLCLAGVAVLVAGLAVWGRDGKMFTYLGLVVVTGSVAWWLRRSVARR